MNDVNWQDWGLYVHIPFCHSRCTYCDFNTITSMGEEDHVRYVEALLSEWAGESLPPGPLVSIYFGGGTPSLMAPRLFERILEAVWNRVAIVAPRVEITMEANPGTLTDDRARDYRHVGINRVSLGAQALQTHHLKDLNRHHDVHDIYSAVKMVRNAKFDNMSLDAIYGLPGQSVSEWDETLRGLLRLDPEHLSLYQLQVESGTPLAEGVKRGRLLLPESDDTADMADLAEVRLKNHGLQRYEISNYARTGYEAVHNRLYWTYNPYLALGAGAHAFDRSRRWWNVRSVRRYMEAMREGTDVTAAQEDLDLGQKMKEYMWLGLRETQGLSRSRFLQAFGKDPYVGFSSRLDKLLRLHLVHMTDRRIVLTERGREMANWVFREFVDSVED